jgi:TPR repeat protein
MSSLAVAVRCSTTPFTVTTTTTAPFSIATTTRRRSSTATTTTNHNNRGEKLYQQYLLDADKLKDLKRDRDHQEFEKSFEEWKSRQYGTEFMLEETRKRFGSKPSQQHDPYPALRDHVDQLLKTCALDYQYPVALVQYANGELQSIRDAIRDASLSTSDVVDESTDEYLTSQYDVEERTVVTPQEVTVVVPLATQKAKVEECFEYYRTAGELGLSGAYYTLGRVLWDGMDGIMEPNHEEALKILDKAMQLGDMDAMFFVGVDRLGHDDEYRTDELQTALEWIERAGRKGHGGALHYLTMLHLNGYPQLEIFPCPRNEFHRRLTKAIQYDESGEAHFFRGCCYQSGESFHPKDIISSLKDFLKASELGHAGACVNAGNILLNGVPGFIDAKRYRSFQLYQQAGELGSIEGWMRVVGCYATGYGVDKCLDRALYLAEINLPEMNMEDTNGQPQAPNNSFLQQVDRRFRHASMERLKRPRKG